MGLNAAQKLLHSKEKVSIVKREPGGECLSLSTRPGICSYNTRIHKEPQKIKQKKNPSHLISKWANYLTR